jgi:hypothetical protein
VLNTILKQEHFLLLRKDYIKSLNLDVKVEHIAKHFILLKKKLGFRCSAEHYCKIHVRTLNIITTQGLGQIFWCI